MEPMINIALRAARKAGENIVRASDDLDRIDIVAKGVNDFVSEVDIAAEQEMRAKVQEMQAKVIEAQAEVPLAIAKAFKDGKLKDDKNTTPEARPLKESELEALRGLAGPAAGKARPKPGGASRARASKRSSQRKR